MFDLGTAIGYIMLDTSGFSKGVKEVKTAYSELTDGSKKFSDRLSGASKQFSSIGSSLTKSLTLPLAALGTASMALATNYQDALTKIANATGAADDEMVKFEKTLKNVYKAGYGESYEDVADAIALIDQQLENLSPEELEDVTESALVLRDTFEYDVGESVRAVDTLMKNFGLTSQQAFDYITYGAQNGLDFSGELLDTINEYAPQFQLLGLSAENMFDIFASGAQAGAWNLDKIGDAVKELGIRVREDSEESRNALGKLGLNADTVAAAFAAGGDEAANAFQRILEGLRAMDDPLEQSKVGVQLFGTMWEDLGPEVITQLDSIRGSAEDASNSIESLKQQKMDDFSTQLEQTKRQAEELGVEIGLQLLPVAQSLMGMISDLVSWFANLDSGTKAFIGTVAAIAFVIGPVIGILGKLAGAIVSIGGALTALGVSGSAALPIIAAVVAALAILLGIILAIKVGSDKVKNPLDDVKNSIPDAGQIQSDFYRTGNGIAGSYASGLDYVPTDRNVRVHEGERILTKEENREYNRTLRGRSYRQSQEVINMTLELDGDVIAQKQYKRNIEQQSLHGNEMIK